MDRLKLIALDREDIEVVSAHLQDAVVKAADIRWRPSEKRLVHRPQPVRLGGGQRRHAAIPPPPRGAALRAGARPASAAIARPCEKDQVLNLLAVAFEADRPARRRRDPDVLGRRCAAPRGRMPGGRTGRSRARPGAPNAARPIPMSSWTAKPSKHPNRVDAPSGAGH